MPEGWVVKRTGEHPSPAPMGLLGFLEVLLPGWIFDLFPFLSPARLACYQLNLPSLFSYLPPAFADPWA